MFYREYNENTVFYVWTLCVKNTHKVEQLGRFLECDVEKSGLCFLGNDEPPKGFRGRNRYNNVYNIER